MRPRRLTEDLPARERRRERRLDPRPVAGEVVRAQQPAPLLGERADEATRGLTDNAVRKRKSREAERARESFVEMIEPKESSE